MWNKNYSCCVVCGGIAAKHAAKGKCSICYLKEYRANPENAKKAKAHKHAWYLAAGGREYAKIKRDARHFESKRHDVLSRDGYKCTMCSKTTYLTVHHIDGNGRGSPTPNNNLSNLITLCRSCHAKEHGTCDGWARLHSKCKECNTTKIAHNAKGYCRLCYSKLYKRHKI